MKNIVLLIAILLVGCSSSDGDSIQQEEKTSVQSEANKFEFPPINQQEPISKVDIHDDKAIVKSVGVPAKKIIDSVDSVGEPKKIYQFADSVFGTQIELSRSQILLAWIAVNEDESSRTKSLASIAVAQRAARAMLGIEGGKLVDEITSKGKIESQQIEGYQVTAGSCVSGLCSLKIQR